MKLKPLVDAKVQQTIVDYLRGGDVSKRRLALHR